LPRAEACMARLSVADALVWWMACGCTRSKIEANGGLGSGVGLPAGWGRRFSRREGVGGWRMRWGGPSSVDVAGVAGGFPGLVEGRRGG
jgi:hypothetical protein